MTDGRPTTSMFLGDSVWRDAVPTLTVKKRSRATAELRVLYRAARERGRKQRLGIQVRKVRA